MLTASKTRYTLLSQHYYLLIFVILSCYACKILGGQPERQQDEFSQPKPIQVYINRPQNNGLFKVGSSFTLQCRFSRNHQAAQSNLKFNLRWLRSLTGNDGENQTITETDIDSSSSTIIAATTRIWSVRKEDGIDLELNYFQVNDSGAYFCQAVSVEPNPTILNEISVQISADIVQNRNEDTNFGTRSKKEDNGDESSSFDSYELYSQENLSKLLPSLKIVPSSFNQIPVGESIQLACITNDLDPDPEPDKLEWIFEPITDRLDLLERSPSVARQLPYNVTVLGNVLIIWSMLEEHSGLYKCTYRMDEFNLTAQASAEVYAISGEQIYSAPLVFVRPELVRLSINGSATIQCETTGYPPPELIWYRVNDFAKSELIVNSTQMSDTASMDHAKILESHIGGLLVERADYKDLAAHCRLNRCLVRGQEASSSASGQQSARLRLTGLSMIHLHDARASHQGQYVCQASNKHGSNQATCIVDVEIKEAPLVSVLAEHRQQTIVLPNQSSSSANNHASFEQQNVTFKCSVTGGRPRPRLRWLRTGGAGTAKTNLEVDNLDLYDLTKVSSATSNVKTIAEDNGSSLTLIISTISLDDEGDYVCLGENEVGRHSSVARLIVQKPASIRILQSSPHVAKLNDSFHLDCLVSGHPIPVDIEWSRTDRGSFFSLISRNLHSQSQEHALLKFDRVTQKELGEYTCNARDPLNPDNILRDTIMVVLGSDEEKMNRSSEFGVGMRQNENNLMPKLMVRPTKINALVGTNVTLDCLAVSGLQPTLVEWLAPTNQQSQQSDTTSIRAYYRDGDLSNNGGQLLQFGSKLKILNVSKAHEGIYQCKGKNRVGIEIAPALIKVTDLRHDDWDSVALAGNKLSRLDRPPYSMSSTGYADQATRTKVAKFGSNIELKCQVNGIEQPATSWSREGLELPKSSVQIGHNLWIQNVTNRDNGLYICSARSREPNRIIQAKINLLVEANQLDSMATTKRFKNLEAKIVASKSQVNKGDSITLECIISSGNLNDSATSTNGPISADDLDEAERNVIWTNLRSGQSLFQDNVYILGNLLIIYELKLENSATYRCNYNDLSQYTDFKLHVSADPSSSDSNDSSAVGMAASSASRHRSDQTLLARGQRAELKQISSGSRLVLDCTSHQGGDYFWSRGSSRLPQATDNRPLVIDSAGPRDAGIYSCNQQAAVASRQPASSRHYLVSVLVPTARFTQSPVSFVTLPTISGANQQQLEIELKFLPENEHGLLLFNGQQQQLQQLSAFNKTPSPIGGGDYLALGMVDGGHLEFKFELGDGTTSLRSLQPLSLNRWHRVMIERNRRGAVMWVDEQPAVSNSSAGKFFNLNLDSVLFVGGHHQFLYQRSAVHGQQQHQQKQQFYGYTKGFQGCLSLLRISRQEINLMARNRSVAVGIFECHKSECAENYCSSQSISEEPSSSASMKSDQFIQQRQVNGVCQVDRDDFDQKWEPTGGQVSAKAGLRCVCMPGLGGENCSEISPWTLNPDASIRGTASTMAVQANTRHQQTSQPGRACELLNPCSNLGTVQCQSLTSQSYLCHCAVGFMGSDCSRPVVYDDEHSIQFNQHSYLQLAFNKTPLVDPNQRNNQSVNVPLTNGASSSSTTEFNATNYARQISMGDNQNISFNLQTNSSYGLLFYTGQLTFSTTGSSASVASSFAGKPANQRPASPLQVQQTSKSMVVNLMWRLSRASVSDYLAIALIDGHVEVSFELGSGVSIMRSAQRVNDNQLHSIQLNRSGKVAKLWIDQVNKYEVSSPGRLSMLNSDREDFYVGGLPLSLSSYGTNMLNSTLGQPSAIYSTHFANFVGCISQLEINSLGPLNLIRSDHLTEVRSAQNLAPCSAASGHLRPAAGSKSQAAKRPNQPYTSPPIDNDEKEADELR